MLAPQTPLGVTAKNKRFRPSERSEESHSTEVRLSIYLREVTVHAAEELSTKSGNPSGHGIRLIDEPAGLWSVASIFSLDPWSRDDIRQARPDREKLLRRPGKEKNTGKNEPNARGEKLLADL